MSDTRTEVQYVGGIAETVELRKFEVTFEVRNPTTDKLDHRWTATWWARDFGHCEDLAVAQLLSNRDDESRIARIELW